MSNDHGAIEATLEHHGDEFKRIAEDQKNQWEDIEKRATKKELTKLEAIVDRIRDRPPLWCMALVSILTFCVGILARGVFG